MADPFSVQHAPEGDWNPFEDIELLELTGELALESEDLEALEAWLLQARAAQLPEESIRPKEERLSLLRGEAGADVEQEVLASAKKKLEKKRLLPAWDLNLNDQERAILEKENVMPVWHENKVVEFTVQLLLPDGTEEVQVNPCDPASSILLKLMPFRDRIPEDFNVFLPSGAALDFQKPLQVQGVHGSMELQVRAAEQLPELLQDTDQFALEAERGWNIIYWPLCVALTSFSEAQQAMQRYPEVVVLGWEACEDLEVMQLAQDVSYHVGSDHLIVTGMEGPPEDWWPTAEEEAALAAEAADACRLRPNAPARPRVSVLRIEKHCDPFQLAPAVLAGLRSAGCGNTLALLVVSRSFKSRRVVSALASLREELRVTVLPYSWDPRYVYLEDCRRRGKEVLLEAQLLTEMTPTVWLAEEGREAELALSQLLQAYKLERPGWHDGFYSKPIKEHARMAKSRDHCEWFRWERPAPLSAESHGKLVRDLRNSSEQDDEEEPPPLVSHES